MVKVVGDYVGRTVATPAGVADVFQLSLEGPGQERERPFPRLACLEVPETLSRSERATLARRLVSIANAVDRQYVTGE